MNSERFTFSEAGIIHRLIRDFLDGNDDVEPFCRGFSTLENLRDHRDKRVLSAERRIELAESLTLQYEILRKEGLDLDATFANISNLKNPSTFTVTTGHQLNLGTGPAFFFIKLMHTVRMAEELNRKWKDTHVVPVYWMASEDHDHEEIDHFYWGNERITWRTRQSGAVGRFSTEEIQELIPRIKEILGPGKKASEIVGTFEKAYSLPTLADATRYLVHSFFGSYGLVIVDGDDTRLKRSMVDVFVDEIERGTSGTLVRKTSDAMSDLGYPIQVNPREINLFYLDDKGRHRLVREEGLFHNGSGLKWTQKEILTEIGEHPDRFSPNVILRPLYQELILPNICYIGGGGEISYWLQLSEVFDHFEVPFPVLWLRNSVLLSTTPISRKREKVDLPWTDFLGKMGEAQTRWVQRHSPLPMDMDEQRSLLRGMFSDLESLAQRTDESMMGAVKAQQAKQLKGLENLEKKLRRAEKRKNDTAMRQIEEICAFIKPGGTLQERHWNFFYLDHLIEEDLLKELHKAMDPLKSELIILS
ncbi:MAG: bacillithiol biosynthesis cysteine-adding enzyme BshC [Bacteroidota bacterium]|nr:bacillithiol biosynthesis cysteine-adding enzyme BshC [Bacteroidota bacterium]